MYNDEQLPIFLWMVPFAVISYGLLGLCSNWNLRHEHFQQLSIGKISQSIINNCLAAFLGYIAWGIYGLVIAWLLSQYINIIILLIGVNRKVKYKYFGISIVMDQVWTYHPQNPNFVNPISLYEKLKGDLEVLDRKINELEFKINSLN